MHGEALVYQGYWNDHSLMSRSGIQYYLFIVTLNIGMKRKEHHDDDDNDDLHKKGGHKGNNGLLGKPSNNKGKKRAVKV